MSKTKKVNQKVVNNKNFKKNCFSVSAIKRYINDSSPNGGKKGFQKALDIQNEKYKTNVTIAQATTLKNIKAVSQGRRFHVIKDAEGNKTVTSHDYYWSNSKGEDKQLFSYWFFESAMSWICQAKASGELAELVEKVA